MEPKRNSFLFFFKHNVYLIIAAALLFTLSFIIDNYWSANANINAVEKRFTHYIQLQQTNFEQLNSNQPLINKIYNDSLSANEMQQLSDKKYFLFFYHVNETDSSQLVLWNTQNSLPAGSILKSTKTSGFIELANGYYVWYKQFNHRGFSVALIPIKWNYIVTNEYLENDFLIGKNWNLYYQIVPNGRVTDKQGNVLFGLQEIAGAQIFQNNSFSIWFKLIGTVLLLGFIHFFLLFLLKRKVSVYKVFACFFVILLGLRILSYFFPYPFNLRQFQLFNPTIYGSNFILRSLGDLFINALMVLWFLFFVRIHLPKKLLQVKKIKPFQKWLFITGAVLLMFLAAYTASYIIRSLIADSSISFNVISFFSLNIYSLIGFVILGCLGISFFFLCQIVLTIIKVNFTFSGWLLYAFICGLGLLILSIGVVPMHQGFEIWLLLWLLLFVFILNYNKVNLFASKFIVSKMIFWVFFFSVSISIIIINENNKKELQQRKHFAEVLAHKSDPANETLLNSMLIDFNPNFLFNHFRILANPSRSLAFRDSLINNNFSGYTNKYDTKVLVFNENELPLYNREKITYNQLNTIYKTQAKPTGIANLYYYDEAYDKFSYISKRTIYNLSDSVLGHVFILATPKSNEGQTLYPELFSRGNNNSLAKASEYAFAIYNNGILVNRHNDYGFATKIDERLFANSIFISKNISGFNELWYNAGNGKVVVLVKESNYFLEAITLFSYLFCAFLILAAVFWSVNVLFKSRLNTNKLKLFWQLNIRHQIHGTVIFFSILSFLVIGAATILFFINKYENNNREKLSTTIQIMDQEIKAAMTTGWSLNDSLTTAGNQKQISLEQMLVKISEIHGVDINVYHTNGDLKVSSLALPYIKGIVSTKMEPMAYYHLTQGNSVQYFQKEQVGHLSFLSIYTPIIDSVGKDYAYLNIPYFTSQSKLKQEISNFLVTIINLNAFIFLIAGIVALYITNRITHSFSVIGEKMKNLNIGQYNERIVWNRKDEIGKLVVEFNKMVKKLDDSAEALAKSEREGAWQEMARQVAHEIKNPLTPMKLSMQFLQRAINNKAPNVEALTKSMTQTLIEQIDHLSKIASEFAQFANIESSNFEKVNITELLMQVQALYGSDETISFNWSLPQQPVIIFADATQINRLFTNLIQNAIQSLSNAQTGIISISSVLHADRIAISVSDNGQGIDEKIRSKIFTPNFTTKTSGTGLGLAMCKRIVEKANGKIYFETVAEQGTTFFVEFPLVAT